ASSGTVCRVDLKRGKMLEEVEVGLHPAGLALSGDGRTLFVACANSDTVSLLKSNRLQVIQQLVVRPDPALPFGSAPGALALSPVPVPARLGEPSVFAHVVYVIKENRTYDQLCGDLKQGRGEPRLCIFPRAVTPNHHALAEEFVLLDNFYCNGVLSADGHSWAVEGDVVDGVEKSFGGWARSYPFPGDDPLAFVSSGFLWDNALLHGLSFRTYGEMRRAQPIP